MARYGKPGYHTTILFQNGPIGEVGTNGVTHEALLAILIDRLESFQAGPYACDENQLALVHLRRGRDFLHERTSSEWRAAWRERTSSEALLRGS